MGHLLHLLGNVCLSVVTSIIGSHVHHRIVRSKQP